MFGILLIKKGRAGLQALRPYYRSGLTGGTMSLSAYWIVIWAATVGSIALVAALRESSVLFATLISILVLREPLSGWRVISAQVIMIGIILLKLG